MKKVLMIATGGTIASDKNEESGKLASGVLTGEDIIEKCDVPSNIGESGFFLSKS